jgi:Protein of unknown function (DUF2281)
MLEAAILDNLDKLPESLKADVLHYVESLVAQHTKIVSEAETVAKPTPSAPPKGSGRAFLEHLKTIGTWAGDDQEECLEAVQNSRGEAQFDYNDRAFDA